MRILHIINVRWYNATAWYAFRLAEGALRIGEDAAIAGLPGSPVTEMAKKEGLSVFEGCLNTGNPFVLFKNFYSLIKFIKKFAPEVVACHRGEVFFLVALYKFFFGKKWKLVRVRGDVRPPKGDIISRFTHNVCCDKIITPNKFMKANYIRILKTPAAKIDVIYGGVDTDFFKPDKQKRVDTRNEFGFKDDDFVVSVVGRFDPVKGHEVFLNACGKLYSKGMKNLKIFLIGFPENIKNDDILRMAAKNGVAEITVITGKRSDINALINACDLGVVSSLGSEAICRVAMEFMATGVTVVASDAGVLPEMMPPENSYKMLDSQELANRIENHIKYIKIYDMSDFYTQFKHACLG